MFIELRRRISGSSYRPLLAAGFATLNGLLRECLRLCLTGYGRIGLFFRKLCGGRSGGCGISRRRCGCRGFRAGKFGHGALVHPLVGEEANDQDDQQTDYEGVVHSSNVRAQNRIAGNAVIFRGL